VTGAPKIAAVDLIAELEPVGRGASMGALGASTERRLRPRADHPHVRDRGRCDPPLGRRRRRLGLRSAAEVEESWTKARPLLAASAPAFPRRRSRDVLALAVTGRGLVDPTEPVIRADDEGLLRGRAAFETLRVYGGRPFSLEAHLDRLTASAASIGYRRSSVGGCKSSSGSSCPRPRAATRRCASSGRGPQAAFRRRSRLLSTVPEWIEETRERGATAVSLLGVRASAPWLLPGCKSTSYAVNMAAEAEARRRGVDEALFVDGDGIVLEGTVTNVWWRGARRSTRRPRPRNPRGRHAGGADPARPRVRVPGRGGGISADQLSAPRRRSRRRRSAR
jgi:4-amino-4-deoxychorismate lyase